MNKNEHKTKDYEDGVYYAMDAQEYHSGHMVRGRLSSGMARLLSDRDVTPGEALTSVLSDRSTRAMDDGTTVHAYLLDGPDRFAVYSGDSWRTLEARKFRDEALISGKIPLLTRELERLESIRDEFSLADELDGGNSEVTYLWTDYVDGEPVRCRARADYVRTDGDSVTIIDLKTTKSLRLRDIERSILRYGYHQQAAHYMRGVRELLLDKEPTFAFIFLDISDPKNSRFITLDEPAIEAGEKLNQVAMSRFRIASDLDEWPNRKLEEEVVSLPSWYLDRVAADCGGF